MEDQNIGKSFGIYTIVCRNEKKTPDGHVLYDCKCNICGRSFIKRLYDIKRTKECRHNCLTWTNSRLGHIYHNMIHRCYNANRADYCWYGAKGVKVCQLWLDNPLMFEQWALQNGYDDNLTIDRIDSNKDYCPENCRWISVEENSRRAGVVRWITVDDITLTGRQWANKLNIGTNIINTCIRGYGMDKTIELIRAMSIDPPANKNREPTQSWFSVYGIDV